MKKHISFLSFFLLFSSMGSALLSEDILVLDQSAHPVRANLSFLGLEEEDVKLPPVFDLPLTTQQVELFNKSPINIFNKGGSWSSQVQISSITASFILLAENILDINQGPRVLSKLPIIPLRKYTASPEINKALSILENAMSQAKPSLDRAVNSIPLENRNKFLEQMEVQISTNSQIQPGIFHKEIKTAYEGMSFFNLPSLFIAGEKVSQGVDQTIKILSPLIYSSPKILPPNGKMEFITKSGPVLIGGAGDTVYSKEELKKYSVIIDLGGHNIYQGAPAAASTNEIRLVFDLGDQITVESEQKFGGNVGSGLFGIGIMACLNPNGAKTFKTLSHGAGCGIGGIGALIAKGKVMVNGKRYTQGVGAMGLGILWTEGNSGQFKAVRSGQGLGLVRGIGIFKHVGDEATITGGLVEPDPREPMGSLSLCQGVGYGPRAYSGGGVGIMTLQGNKSRIMGSYFAQGCGYWHGAGFFSVNGDQNEIQARRYTQGSGVHSAFGYFRLQGNQNHITNWGVGPAYGWDRSVGSLFVEGSKNTFQAEWGTGSAAIGSYSFSIINGDANQFFLPDFASGGFSRNEFSYSLHSLSGVKNLFKSSRLRSASEEGTLRTPNLWGVMGFSGVEFSTTIIPSPVVWPQLENEPTDEPQTIPLSELLHQASLKSTSEKISDLVDIAAAFGMDKATPREARRQLLSISTSNVVDVINQIDPSATDQFIQLRTIIPALGDEAGKTLANKALSSEGRNQAAFLGLLDLHHPKIGIPLLLKKVNDESLPIAIRTTAIRTLGRFYNRDRGEEPGLRAIYESINRFIKSGRNKSEKKYVSQLLKKAFLSESFSILSSTKLSTPESRLKLIELANPDITEPIGEKAAFFLMDFIDKNSKSALPEVEDILKTLEDNESSARENLFQLFDSSRSLTLQSAVVSLGQIGNQKDLAFLSMLIQHPRASVRNSASIALARQGQEGIAILDAAFDRSKSATRNVILTALSQATDEKALPILEKGLQDPDSNVRLKALTLLNQLPSPFEKHKTSLIKKAQKLMKNDRDSSVKLGLSFLK